MTDEEPRQVYDLTVAIGSESISVTGEGFSVVKVLGIDIQHLWHDGFRGTIHIKGELL